MTRPPLALTALIRTAWLFSLAGLFAAWSPLSAQAKIYADKESHLYHSDTCPAKDQIKPKYLRIFNAEQEAESRGFYPCEKCITPSNQPSQIDQTGKKLSLPLKREQTYVGQRNSKVYHYDWCTVLQDLPAEERVMFPSARVAAQKGYQPCPECNPPAMFQRINPEFAPASQTPEPVPTPPAPPNLEQSSGEIP
ncbi:MAG: hypothetical protein AB1439_09350 [candidate division FCPU426 bacterium]